MTQKIKDSTIRTPPKKGVGTSNTNSETHVICV